MRKKWFYLFFVFVFGNEVYSDSEVCDKKMFRSVVNDRLVLLSEKYNFSSDGGNQSPIFDRYLFPIDSLKTDSIPFQYVTWYKESIEQDVVLIQSVNKERHAVLNEKFKKTACDSLSVIVSLSPEEILKATNDLLDIHDRICDRFIQRIAALDGVVVDRSYFEELNKIYAISSDSNKENILVFCIKDALEQLKQSKIEELKNVFFVGKLIGEIRGSSPNVLQEKAEKVMDYVFSEKSKDRFFEFVSPPVDMIGIISAAEAPLILPEFNPEKDVGNFFQTSGIAGKEDGVKIRIRNETWDRNIEQLREVLDKIKK